MFDELIINEDDPLLSSPFIRELLRQLRALDSYGAYESWSDARVLDPLIMTRARKRELPLTADPDDVTLSNIRAYYNALAVMIEQESGHMACPLISLSHEGFGRVMIVVGKLVVLDKVLRDAHRFGFASLEQINDDSAGILAQARTLVGDHPRVAAI